MYEGEATRRGQHTAAAWLINGDLGERTIKKRIRDVEYCGGHGKAPSRGVSSRRRERGGAIRRGPRTLCYRGGECEVARERSGFGTITLSSGE
uniref:Uncharacterized protein n=1 Tax=Setaria viridis TaxID=4556 RepID=A0A4U6VGW0_SETVI|nr:hypothetical protein SEVIR_3G353300v2 [Setaria viridis]